MKNILYILITIILFSSCDDNEFESVFSKSPDERVMESCEQLRNVLASAENGWKTTYFMNNGIGLAFYQIYDFKEDMQVAITTTSYSDPKLSEYMVFGESSIELKFTTWNDNLTWLSEPNGSFRQGFGAEMEFILVSCSESKIVFEGKVNKKQFILEKASVQDRNLDLANNYYMLFKQLQKYSYTNVLIEDGVEGASKENPIIATMKFKEGETFLFNLSYSTSDGEKVSLSSSTCFTPYGLTIANPISIGGKEIRNFTYDSNSKQFIIAEKEISGKIINTAFPIIAVPGVVDEINKVKHQFSIRDNDSDNHKDFNAIMAAILNYRGYPNFSFSRVMYVVDYTETLPVLDDDGRIMKDENNKDITKQGKNLGNGFLFSTSYSKDYKYVFIPVEVEKIVEDRAKFTLKEAVCNFEGGLEYLQGMEEYDEFIKLFSDEDGFYLVKDTRSYGVGMTFTKLSDPKYSFGMSDYKF